MSPKEPLSERAPLHHRHAQPRRLLPGPSTAALEKKLRVERRAPRVEASVPRRSYFILVCWCWCRCWSHAPPVSLRDGIQIVWRLSVHVIRQKAHSSDVSRAQLKYRTVELSKEQAKVLYAKGQPCYRARLVRQPTSLEPGHAEVSASSTLLSCFPSPLTAPPSSPPYCRHDAVKKDDPTSGINKQTPFLQTPDQAYATVINCRPPAGKRAAFAQEVRSHNVPLAKVEGSLKRKRGEDSKREYDQAAHSSASYASNAMAPLATATARPLLTQQWQQRKPTRLRRGKVLSKGVDLDCWFIILSYSDPAQLLEMRSKIASCYRFLRDNPMLWKHSRVYYYGTDMPDPPPGLTEFQFAHLRHGHGCMDCGAPNTRKTFWAFLRRMCKDCLTNQVIKEYEAIALLKGPDGEDISFIRAALPSGIYDSWGNFVGVGPASTHALKTIYLRSDVDKLVAEYNRELRERAPDANESPAWIAAWLASKAQRIEERQAFAKKMEQWEEMQRTARTAEYSSKKSRRKAYFKEKAAQLSPPIGIKELEACPSYKRAVTIPKDPNNTSWDLLKPKIVKEAAEIAARRSLEESHPPTASSSGISTPTSSMTGYPHAHLYLGTIMGLPPPDHHHHMFH